MAGSQDGELAKEGKGAYTHTRSTLPIKEDYPSFLPGMAQMEHTDAAYCEPTAESTDALRTIDSKQKVGGVL